MSPSAGSDDVRRAYLDRAREAHPDRHIDASGAQRADAERRMQEVNEAWRVLGNPRRRRRRYDLERAPETMFVSRSDGTMPHDYRPDGEVLEEIDSTTRLIRGLPWMILVFVLFAIFVFTAYAATGGDKANPLPSNNLGRCVAVGLGGGRGHAGRETPRRAAPPAHDSSWPRSTRISRVPQGPERLQPSTGATVYCLEV